MIKKHKKAHLEKSKNIHINTFLKDDKYKFKVNFFYPVNQEFLDEQDLKSKITNFYKVILKDNNNTFNFEIDAIGIGNQFVKSKQKYLISFEGTASREYLEIGTNTIVEMLANLLETYFLCIQKEQLKPIYFRFDEQILIDLSSDFQDSMSCSYWVSKKLIYLFKNAFNLS